MPYHVVHGSRHLGLIASDASTKKKPVWRAKNCYNENVMCILSPHYLTCGNKSLRWIFPSKNTFRRIMIRDISICVVIRQEDHWVSLPFKNRTSFHTTKISLMSAEARIYDLFSKMHWDKALHSTGPYCVMTF